MSVQNRAGLRHFLDSFAGADHSTPAPVTRNTQTTTLPDSKCNNTTIVDSSSSGQSQTVTEMRLVDLLDSTLWNRKLAPSSERLVCALVHQIFHGIKEHFLVSTELKVDFPYQFFYLIILWTNKCGKIDKNECSFYKENRTFFL